MQNHPNRNWRRRMQEAADQFLARWPWQPDAGARLLTEAELQDIMLRAYIAGFKDGRTPAPKP